MCVKEKISNVTKIIGIITLVMMPVIIRAQSLSEYSGPKPEPVQRTFTAPPPSTPAKQQKQELKAFAVNEVGRQSIFGVEPHIEILKVKEGNPDHIPAGFYASYKPKSYDTVYIYEGGTEQFEVINVHAGKEVIQGDSNSVAEEVDFRMNHLNANGIPVINEKHGKTNSMIIRSGFIPAQGFGSKRYRFAVKPGEFGLSDNSMISASVHILNGANIGTILCAVTNIDFEKGIFYVEASNEIPKGETINWIIVNSP